MNAADELNVAPMSHAGKLHPTLGNLMCNRVLVVDDNEDAAEMMALALRSYGYDVRTAADGRAALDVAGAFRPDVALVDIDLPDMDGYELARRLRASVGALQIVALTGYARPSDKARSTEAGFLAHLVKPVAAREVRRLLNSLGGQ